DHPAADLRPRKLNVVLPECLAERRVNGRAAVDECAIAVEDREALHRRFAFGCEPRARRSPRRSRRRAFAAAATRRPVEGAALTGSTSPAAASKPIVARLSA